jgi:hypothetical protein
MARVTSEVYLWDKWTVVVDTENGVVRLESEGRVDEEWTGLEIERKTQSEWRTTHPEFGAITINVQHGCKCGGSHFKTDTRGRAMPRI